MEFTVGQIAELIGGTVEGDKHLKINKISKIQEGGKGSITFFSNPKYEPFLYETTASAVILSKDFDLKKEIDITKILVDDAYLGFTQLLEEYYKIKSFEKKGIEHPVFIHAKAKYGEACYFGAFSYIGEHAKIGNNVKIYPQAYIGDNVTIGDNTIILPGAKIYPNSIIGKYCLIQAGAVIGSYGFGYAPQKDGSYKAIPQVGNVVLEDFVDIGANTTIDCATFDSTVIHEGAKLDNLIQIAHNVEIGKNTVIAAQSGISGSTIVGNNCIIAGQVGIVGHIEITDKVTIAAQSGVSKSIHEKGAILIGSPAIERNEFFKSYAIFRKLPKLLDRIKVLEDQLAK